MRDVIAPNTVLGYCTNVHAGADLDAALANLERYALRVKAQVSSDAPMGVGLWLAADAARQLISEQRVDDLRDWLDQRGLEVFTLNGFPFGDFHQPVVKHRVYEPDWTTPDRLQYTLDLAQILAALRPEESEGSISTLPIGWPTLMGASPEQREQAMRTAAAQLTDLVHHFARLELDTGRLIHIDLEPEPGCCLDTADDVVQFFQRYLLGTRDDESVLAYLRVCHDVCHAAVMFEEQASVFRRYREAGISVGKVQVSSAVRVAFDALAPAERDGAMAQLRSFAEDRYLHQTVVQRDGQTHFFEDLVQALDTEPAAGEWRVHFHVPIHLERFGAIDTTQAHIAGALAAARAAGVPHFEVETYAWNVLPVELRVDNLADGVARELAWLTDAVATGRAQ